jgi:hypothetical protein
LQGEAGKGAKAGRNFAALTIIQRLHLVWAMRCLFWAIPGASGEFPVLRGSAISGGKARPHLFLGGGLRAYLHAAS